MNLWLISTCELQTDFILKEDASSTKPRPHPRLPKTLLKFLPIYGNLFREKYFLGFSDCFIATPEFQIFSAKSIMMIKVVMCLTKS